MKTTQTPYVKSLDDELDWKHVDQLYGIVSQISNFCFETKKFCVTTEFVVLAFLVKFTADKLDRSIFVAGIIIPLCFWILDSIAYFYQVKIRGAMESARVRIKERDVSRIVDTDGAPVIERNRVERKMWRRILDAVINPSMLLYLILILVDVGVWMAFALRAIK